MLKAFLPNVSNSSPAMRRSSVTSILLLCEYSRKPNFFMMWIIDSALQMLIPIQNDTSTQTINGCLLLLRCLAPHFENLSYIPESSTYSHERDKSPWALLSLDHIMQVNCYCDIIEM